MTPQLAALFDCHAASSLDKQWHLDEAVVGRAHRLEVAAGRLAFGEHPPWKVHLLGKESEAGRTWRWAWAEQGRYVSPDLLRSAAFVRAVGAIQKAPELTEPELPLGQVDGEHLAAVACGVCRAQAYFRAPQEGGAVYALIVDERFPRRAGPPLARIRAVFPEAVRRLPISDQKAAWSGYLRYYGLHGVERGNVIAVEGADGRALAATFDGQGRLVCLKGDIEPTRSPPAGAGPAERPRGAAGGARVPVVAFGPVMPGWGSWDWVGADVQRELGRYYRTVAFRDQDVPDCDALVIVKHPLAQEVVERAARRGAVLYCPIDAYGSSAEIEADAPLLSRCARIVVHCERLRRHLSPYAPVVYLDHHVKFVPPQQPRRDAGGPILWVGVRTNLPPLVEWVNAHPLPCELCVLTNPAVPGRVPSATEFGFRTGLPVRVEEWSRDLHLRLALESRAALDVKGDDFRARHKPPAKAIDFLAAGLPLAMPPGSSAVEHLAGMGFEVASPRDPERWLSGEYLEETRRFGAALRELLSLERVGRRYKLVIDEALAERCR